MTGKDEAKPGPRDGGPGSALSPLTAAIVTCAGLLLITFALRELSWLATPMLFAVLIVTLVHPLYGYLLSRGVPRYVSIVGLLGAVYGSLVLVGGLVIYAISRFVSMLPGYAEDLQEIVADTRAALRDLGIGTLQTQELLAGIDIPATVRWVTLQIPSLLGLVTMTVLVGTVLLFLGIESTQLSLRTQALSRAHGRLYEELVRAAGRTRRFFAVATVFAIIVGALDTIVLMILGIPLAPLWGLLAAVCNYIPYLGFWIGMAPPALLALGLHGWRTAVTVAVIYLVLNFVITSLLPTKFIGDAVGLSMTIEVVAIVFWAWALGPLGAILAVPLTILAKAVLVDAHPHLAWAQGFLGSAKSLTNRVSEPDRTGPT